ncbi:MAG: hypothetical protein ICV72_11345 [Aldersonia sp.]|nr:hypothetical protein [Aldersonia sp.]
MVFKIRQPSRKVDSLDADPSGRAEALPPLSESPHAVAVASTTVADALTTKAVRIARLRQIALIERLPFAGRSLRRAGSIDFSTSRRRPDSVDVSIVLRTVTSFSVVNVRFPQLRRTSDQNGPPFIGKVDWIE